MVFDGFVSVPTMNCELGSGVVVSSATDVGACISRSTFVDNQGALSAQGMDAKILPGLQFHIILKSFICITHSL